MLMLVDQSETVSDVSVRSPAVFPFSVKDQAGCVCVCVCVEVKQVESTSSSFGNIKSQNDFILSFD